MSDPILERRLTAAIISAKFVSLFFIAAMFVGMAWDLAHNNKADVRLFPLGIGLAMIAQFGAWMVLRNVRKQSNGQDHQ